MAAAKNKGRGRFQWAIRGSHVLHGKTGEYRL